jgi:fatty acid desaturase
MPIVLVQVQREFCPTEIFSSQWRHSHNYRHHVFTKCHRHDDDLGYVSCG